MTEYLFLSVKLDTFNLCNLEVLCHCDLTQGAGSIVGLVTCRKSLEHSWSCTSGICYSQRFVFVLQK